MACLSSICTEWPCQQKCLRMFFRCDLVWPDFHQLQKVARSTPYLSQQREATSVKCWLHVPALPHLPFAGSGCVLWPTPAHFPTMPISSAPRGLYTWSGSAVTAGTSESYHSSQRAAFSHDWKNLSCLWSFQRLDNSVFTPKRPRIWKWWRVQSCCDLWSFYCEYKDTVLK